MGSNLKLLSDIADVKLGLAFKQAIIDIEEKGTCYLIQTKNINIEGNIDMGGVARIEAEASFEKYFLKAGDVLLRLRGPVFSAAVFNKTLSMPAITNNPIAVIRCNTKIVSPYYLQWFINSQLGQNYFNAIAEGTSIHKISPKRVSSMSLSLPSREQQEKIELIHKNWLAQKNTYRKLIDNGDALYNQLCKNIQMETK